MMFTMYNDVRDTMIDKRAWRVLVFGNATSRKGGILRIQTLTKRRYRTESTNTQSKLQRQSLEGTETQALARAKFMSNQKSNRATMFERLQRAGPTSRRISHLIPAT